MHRKIYRPIFHDRRVNYGWTRSDQALLSVDIQPLTTGDVKCLSVRVQAVEAINARSKRDWRQEFIEEEDEGVYDPGTNEWN